jgi:hypothetical protein
VLAPHQTIKERNISHYILSSGHEPVWIRTCYAADLEGAWESILELATSFRGIAEAVLKNEALYDDCGENWAKVFIRLPLLPDIRYYEEDPLDEDLICDCEGHKDEAYKALHNAAHLQEQVIYLVDEQALRKKLVKLIYLDTHGKAVWYNTIAPEHVVWYEAYYCARGMLTWIQEFCYNDESLLTPGAQLQGDQM